MTLDATRYDTQNDLDLRPASENSAIPESTVAWRATDERIINGNVIPAQHAYASPFHGQHPAYAPLPLHVAALIDHHDLPRPHPQAIELIRRYHLAPSIGVCAFSALGWWANLEPDHVLLMLPFLGLGILGPIAGFVGHLIHGAEADTHLTRGLIIGGAAGMSGAAAVGAGLSGISALASALLAAIGTLGSIQWRAHRRQADRDFIVDYHAAVAGAPMPPAPVGTLPGADLTKHGIQSDESARLHMAFAAMGVSPIQVDVIRRVGDGLWETYVYLPEGRTTNPQAVLGRRDVLRSNLRYRSVDIERSTAIGNRIRVTVDDRQEDPHGDVEPWPGPNTDDITVPINIGVDSRRQPVAFNLRQRNTLYAGVMGAGKSGGVNVAVCSVAAMRNAVLWLLDLKPGQLELGPYEGVADQSAAGIVQATQLLIAAIAAMESRGQQLKEERESTGRPVREWDPNNPNHGPAIVIVIDELAQLMRLDPKIFVLWVTLMQVARALGIWIIAATQSPSGKALGNTTDGKGQFTNIAAFRTESATQTNVILGPGAHGDGWRTDGATLPLQGMFLPRSPEHTRPEACRGYYIDPDTVMDVVAAYKDRRPRLDARTAAAVQAALEAAEDYVPPPSGTDDDSVDVANEFHADIRHLHAVPTYPDKTVVEERHRDAWDLFRSLGSATVLEFKGHQLPGLKSRESCMGVLNVFRTHGGATSQTDDDGRSERFVSTAARNLRRDA